MNRRTVATLTLVALAAIAGCNGLADDPGTADEAVTTQSVGGTVADPAANGSAVLADHRAALAEGGSFRYAQNATVRQRDGSGTLQLTNVTAAVALEEGRLLARQNVTLQGPAVVYADGEGHAYERVPTAEGPQYREPASRSADTGFYARPPLERYLDGLEYSRTGTEPVDGVTVYTYEATNLSQLTPEDHGLTVVPPENVTSIDSRIRIDETGLVRAFEYRIVGTNYRGDELVYDLSLSYSDVGATTVTAPEWLPEARNATGDAA